jgi:hypothetical protein
MLELGF